MSKKRNRPSKAFPSSMTHAVPASIKSRKVGPEFTRMSAGHGVEAGMSWCVVRCWTQGEQAVVRRIKKALGYPTFLPLLSRKHERRGRSMQIIRAMFPGYLFVSIGSRPLRPLLEVLGVIEVMRIERVDGDFTPLPVPGNFMDELIEWSRTPVQQQQSDREDDLRRMFASMIGQQFRVTSGPFASFGALVTGQTEDGHVEAQITLLGRPTQFVLDVDQLEPV